MKKIFSYLIAILIGASVVGGISCYMNSVDQESKKGTATNEIVKQKLMDASDLVTQKLIDYGTVFYDNEGIPVLTQSTYYMNYEATVSAGIDFSEVKIDGIDNDNFIIRITAPKTKILDVNVNPDSLEFDQTSVTMFDMTSKEDVKKAVSYAAKDCRKKAKKSGLLENGDSQLTTLLKGLMATNFPDYTTEVYLVED